MKFHILVFTSIIASVIGTECEQPLVYCLNESSYSLNVTIFGTLFNFGVELNCPEGYYCHEATNTPCQINPPTTSTDEPTTEYTTIEDTTIEPTTPTPTSTTTPKPNTVGPPTCTKEGYHPAPSCNQYYECVRAMWWFDVKTKYCSTGYYFSSKKPPCDKPPNVDCTD